MQAFNTILSFFTKTLFLLAILLFASNNMRAQCGDTILSPTVINTFPYQEDFENGKGGWFDASIASNFPNPASLPTPVPHFPGFAIPNTWAFGTPNKTRISSAHSGDSAWVNGGLTGNYATQEHSYVASPQFDFTNLSSPVFGVWVNYDTETNIDGACIQTSIDSGRTWQRMGSVGTGLGWYTRRTLFASPGKICAPANGHGWGGWSRGWKWSQHDIGYLGGEPSVMIRIVFAADFLQTAQGFAFDDIAIVEKPTTSLGPDTALCLGDQKIYDLGFVPNGRYYWKTPNVFTQSLTVVTNPSGLPQQVWGCVEDTVLGFTFCDTVIVNSSLLIPPNITDSIFCEGDSIRYNLLNPGANWAWYAYDSSVFSFVLISNNRFLVTDTSALYIYRVSDNLGCIFSDTIESRLEKTPPIDLGPGDTVCIGESRVFSAPNGPPGTMYEWRLNSIPNPFANTQTIFASAPGRYTVSLITPAGCTEIDSVDFGVELAPVVDLGPDSRECYPITLNANNAGSSFLWNNGDTSQTLTVTPPYTGWVEVTNYLGCSARDSIVITAGVPPTVDLGGDKVLCDQSSIILDAGTQPMGSTIRWCTGSFGQALLVTSPGQHCCVVTDPDGCIGTDTIDITISALKIDLGPDPFLCDGETLDLDAEFPGAQYQWNTGARTPSIQVSSGGIYGVVISDSLGCIKSDSVTVTQRPPYNAAIGFSPSATVPFGDPITFSSTNNPTGTNSWTWFFGDGNSASGQTVNYTYASLDTFEVCLIMSDGICSDTVCDDAGNFLVFIGIEEEMGISMGVFPNPTKDVVHVAAQLKEASELKLGLWDVKGRMLHQEAFSKGLTFDQSLNLSSYANGIYFLKIQTDKGTTFRKILKQ